MTWGALMAGLRAGTSHNTFPTIRATGSRPAVRPQPVVDHFFETATIQFVHRWLAKFWCGVLALAGAHAGRDAGGGGDWRCCSSGSESQPSERVNIRWRPPIRPARSLLLTTVIIVRHRALPSPARPLSAKVGAWV